jgi:hypothetical protein
MKSSCAILTASYTGEFFFAIHGQSRRDQRVTDPTHLHTRVPRKTAACTRLRQINREK